MKAADLHLQTYERSYFLDRSSRDAQLLARASQQRCSVYTPVVLSCAKERDRHPVSNELLKSATHREPGSTGSKSGFGHLGYCNSTAQPHRCPRRSPRAAASSAGSSVKLPNALHFAPDSRAFTASTTVSFTGTATPNCLARDTRAPSSASISVRRPASKC